MRCPDPSSASLFLPNLDFIRRKHGKKSVMRPVAFALLFQLLATTLFSAQFQHPLSARQTAQVRPRRVQLQRSLPLLNLWPLGRGSQGPGAQFSSWNGGTNKHAMNVHWAGMLAANPGSNPLFLEAPTYDSGGAFAESVAIADVNNDAKPDLVVANEDGVDVLLGNGDGTFQPAIGYGSGGSDVVVADVNGDAKPDLLVANQCADSSCVTGSVAVLLGNGDGTFQTAVTYSSGGYSNFSVAVADVNGDGKPDLLTTNFCTDNNCLGDGSVGVLRGNGDGTFQPVVTYDSGGRFTLSVVAGDVNGDGKPDLLVANNCVDSNCANGSVGVLLGTGQGFQPVVTYGSGGYGAASVAIADVNGDRNVDLLVANAICLPLGVCTSGSVGVLLGNGNGTFQTAVAYDSGGFSADSVAAVDVNGDGKVDLLVANTCVNDGAFQCTTGSVGVLFGNQDGSFQAAVSYGSSGNGAFSAKVADVNRDGKPDLVVANDCGDGGGYSCSAGSLAILLNRGDGSFLAAVNYSSGGYEAQSLASADVNKDGEPDLVIANQSDASNSEGSIGVLLNNGDGSLQAPAKYNSGGFQADSVAVLDVNRDHKPDLIVANRCGNSSACNNGNVGVLLGNGDGTFQTLASYALQGFPNSVAVADVNGDGKPDLLTASSNTVEVLLGNGDGTFQSPLENTTGLNSQSIAVGDVNGDGKPDLVVANEGDGTPNSGSVSVLPGNGDGTFQPANTYSSGAIYTDAIAVGDMNGDGKLDLVVASQYSNGPPYNGVIGILLGNGDGSFQPPKNASTPTPLEGVRQLALADFDGDGKLDVAVGAGNLLLLGNGDGTFRAPIVLGAGGPGITTGDFNCDGKPDIAVGGVTVLLSVGASPTTTSIVSSSNPSLFGHSVTFMSTVTSQGRGTPSGSVTFSDGAHVLATVSLSNGQASFSTSGLSVGSHAITATYSGDDRFLPSHSKVLIEVIVDRTPPIITISETPSTIWPPNGKMVPVSVQGVITDTGSGVNASTSRYTVVDEYGRVQPSGSITLLAGGKYSFRILLQASRNGSDKDGRQYVIIVSAKDNAGNLGSAFTTVTVPHDQAH